MRCEGCGDELRGVKRQGGGDTDGTKRPPVGLSAYVCGNELCDRFGLTVQRDAAVEPKTAPHAKSWRRWRALKS